MLIAFILAASIVLQVFAQQGYLPNRRKSFLPATGGGGGGGGGGKSFAQVGIVHHLYTGTSVTFTPTAGNALVCFASGGGSAVIVISDNAGNTWSQLKTVSDPTHTSLRMVGAVALSVAGISTTVTATAVGTSDVGITVLEYSGVTGVLDSSANGSSTSIVNTLTASETCMFVLGWADETANSFTSTTLTPGSVSGSLAQRDTGHFDGQWAFLNAGAGFAANSYTITTAASAVSGSCIAICLK